MNNQLEKHNEKYLHISKRVFLGTLGLIGGEYVLVSLIRTIFTEIPTLEGVPGFFILGMFFGMAILMVGVVALPAYLGLWASEE